MDAQDRRKSRKRPKNPISLMNLHNNEAGRKVRSGIGFLKLGERGQEKETGATATSPRSRTGNNTGCYFHWSAQKSTKQ